MSKTESVQWHEERRAQWRGLVDQARESGQRPGQLCRGHGLELAKFYCWRREIALKHSERFTETHCALVGRGVASKKEGGDAGVEFQTYGGWRLLIPRGVDEATLRLYWGHC